MIDPRLKLRHLHALLSVASAGTVQRSASALSRTPSAVSKSLSELESMLGQSLFVRTRRGLLPTPVCERLIRDAERALGLLDGAMREASVPGSGDGDGVSLGVGLLPTATAVLAPAAILDFQARLPAFRIRVVSQRNDPMLARLRARELDLIVGRLGEPSQLFDLTFEPLYEECTVCVVAPGHPLAGVDRLDLGALRDFPVILPESGTVLRSTLDPYLVGSGLDRPLRSYESLSASFARSLVVASDVIWFSAPGVVEPDVRRGLLVTLDLDLGFTRRHVGMTMRADGEDSFALSLLAEAFRRQARLLRVAPSPLEST